MMQQWCSRGIRGAITVNENTEEDINTATLELLTEIISQNDINSEDICSAFFTLTEDINAVFPAKTPREKLKGWADVPMVCAKEIPVPNSIKKCIRVLLTVNTTKKQSEIKHVYLGNAKNLRPDITT